MSVANLWNSHPLPKQGHKKAVGGAIENYKDGEGDFMHHRVHVPSAPNTARKFYEDQPQRPACALPPQEYEVDATRPFIPGPRAQQQIRPRKQDLVSEADFRKANHPSVKQTSTTLPEIGSSSPSPSKPKTAGCAAFAELALQRHIPPFPGIRVEPLRPQFYDRSATETFTTKEPTMRLYATTPRTLDPSTPQQSLHSSRATSLATTPRLLSRERTTSSSRDRSPRSFRLSSSLTTAGGWSGISDGDDAQTPLSARSKKSHSPRVPSYQSAVNSPFSRSAKSNITKIRADDFSQLYAVAEQERTAEFNRELLEPSKVPNEIAAFEVRLMRLAEKKVDRSLSGDF